MNEMKSCIESSIRDALAKATKHRRPPTHAHLAGRSTPFGRYMDEVCWAEQELANTYDRIAQAFESLLQEEKSMTAAEAQPVTTPDPETELGASALPGDDAVDTRETIHLLDPAFAARVQMIRRIGAGSDGR